jgi:hypothetical protein
MAAAVTVVVLVIVAVLFAVGVLKQRLRRTPMDWDIGSDDDWGPAGVREPRRPLPTSGAATTVAEPDEEAA